MLPSIIAYIVGFIILVAIMIYGVTLLPAWLILVWMFVVFAISVIFWELTMELKLIVIFIIAFLIGIGVAGETVKLPAWLTSVPVWGSMVAGILWFINAITITLFLTIVAMLVIFILGKIAPIIGG